jgi:hypothetical protein
MLTVWSMKRDAHFSQDRKFRYFLSRIWDDTLPTVTFIGLNPSTADEKADDRTITTCMAYAKQWGKGGLFVANLFAFRDTCQTQIWNVPDPIGPENDKWLVDLASKSSLVVAAWGDDGLRFERSGAVCRLLPRLHCLKVNKSGEPHHPLYLSRDIKPQPYNRHAGTQ